MRTPARGARRTVQGDRDEGPLFARPLRARQRVGGDRRSPSRVAKLPDCGAPSRRSAPRRRKAESRRDRPQEAGAAQRPRVRRDQAPSAGRGADDPWAEAAQAGPAVRPLPPRALGRHGLPERPLARADPGGRPNRCGGGRLRRDDLDAALPGAAAARNRNAGSQFDPSVVRAFLAAWAEGEIDRFLPDHRLSA